MGGDTRKGAGRTAERQITWQRWLGLLCCAAGFVVIGVGWAGAARLTCVDCQLPYLLSGGAVGLGLIVFGIGMLVMAQVRTEGRRWASRLEQAFGGLTAAPPGAVPDSQLVVVGRSTYHRPECRLVAGKSELPVIPFDAARMQGMSSCRVCKPDSALAEEPATVRESPREETATPGDVVPEIDARAEGNEDLSRAEREAFGAAQGPDGEAHAEEAAARASEAAAQATAVTTAEESGARRTPFARRRQAHRR